MAPMRRTARQAFTLIELLVVIAIIAILTAILLPVFASVREGARQGTSISNMKDIQQKMEQFKLDNHRYPDVLFGYYYPGTTARPGSTLQNALGEVQADDVANGTHNAILYFPGLYPAYIKDPQEFTDPNNTVNATDMNKTTGPLATNIIAPCNAANDGILNGTGSSNCTGATPGYFAANANGASTTRNFYLADAYDSSPMVTGTNTLGVILVVRYQPARENTTTPVPTTEPDASIYREQLRWQNPPAETLITATTYHVKNADKVLAIFESGAVKKITGHDFAALETSGNPPTPTFWQVANWPANLKP